MLSRLNLERTSTNTSLKWRSSTLRRQICRLHHTAHHTLVGLVWPRHGPHNPSPNLNRTSVMIHLTLTWRMQVNYTTKDVGLTILCHHHLLRANSNHLSGNRNHFSTNFLRALSNVRISLKLQQASKLLLGVR